MLDNLNLDHIAINVKENMDEAYQLFSELGFRLTPRGYHSLGSINHSMVFNNDYLELIGTPRGKPVTRPELKKAEIGINGLVFKSDNIKKTLSGIPQKRESNPEPTHLIGEQVPDTKNAAHLKNAQPSFCIKQAQVWFAWMWK